MVRCSSDNLPCFIPAILPAGYVLPTLRRQLGGLDADSTHLLILDHGSSAAHLPKVPLMSKPSLSLHRLFGTLVRAIAPATDTLAALLSAQTPENGVLLTDKAQVTAFGQLIGVGGHGCSIPYVGA